MSAARAEEIGRQELRGVFGDGDVAVEVRKHLESAGIVTLGMFLSMKKGAFGKSTDDEEKEATTLAAAAKGARSKLGAVDDDVIESRILEAAASARVRGPAYFERLHKEQGLKKGTGASTLDEESLWKGLALQRLGRPVRNADKGSTELLKSLWDGLAGGDMRRLPEVDLRTVENRPGRKGEGLVNHEGDVRREGDDRDDHPGRRRRDRAHAPEGEV